MEIGILGPLVVVADGKPLDLGSPKQQAVLAALVVAGGRAVSLDRLVEELWGDEPPAQATASLQAYVSKLRRILEPDRPPREPPRVLLTKASGYVLAVDPDRVDAARFTAAAAEGRRLLREGRSAEARARLRAGLDLWRGAALEDFAGERFAQVEAARLEELRLVATEDLLQAAVDLGAHDEAVPDLARLTVAHPERERLWELRMLALYRAGRQGEALRAYQAARQVLAEEMGIEPGPALRRMESEVLAQSPALDRPSPLEPAPAAPGARPPAAPWAGPPPGPAPGPAPAPETPLVGRRRELADLVAALDEAAAGRGRVATVAGEAGIGKTRLVEALAAEARRRGLQVAWGGGYDGEGVPAFWPWVPVLRDVAAALVEAGDDGPGPEIARIVPGLAPPGGGPPTQAASDPDTARFRLFEAVAGLLARAAARRPVVVALDDLHWADVASLQLLSFLGARLASLPVLVVATFRPTDVDRAHPLVECMASLARHQVVGRVELGGLTDPEVAEVVETATGTAVDPATAATLRERTGGNPFYVAELARLLDAERHSPEHLLHAVPAGVRDVVRRRLARLPEDTVATLLLAALAGRTFDLRLLEEAGDLDPDDALDRVELALAAGFLAEDGAVAGRYRFGHDLVREALREELSSARRARLHARLGLALEALAGDDDDRAFEIADHFFHSSADALGGKAVAAALRSARVASGRLAFEQAEDQLRRALEVTERLERGPVRDRHELDVLVELSSLLVMTRGYASPQAGQTLRRARALCERVGERERLVPVLWRLGAFHMVSAELPSAEQVCADLLEVADRHGVAADRVSAHIGMGITNLQQGRLAESRHHLEQALALPDGLADPWLASWLPQHPEVSCATFLSWALWLAGEPAQAGDLARRAVDIAGRLGHDFSTVHALLFDAWGAAWSGRREHAREQAAATVALAEARGFPLYRAMGTATGGWAALLLGDPGAGARDLAAGIEAMRATGAWMLQTFFLALLAEALRAAGRDGEAAGKVDEGLRLAERTGERFYEPELRRLRAELLVGAAAADGPEARRELARAVALADEQGSAMLQARAAESLERLAGVVRHL